MFDIIAQNLDKFKQSIIKNKNYINISILVFSSDINWNYQTNEFIYQFFLLFFSFASKI